MPEICRFFGISIRMYYNDHDPPHFHVVYGEQKALVDIRTLMVIEGRLSPRVLGMVMEWASQYQEALMELWERARNYQPLYKLPPLA